MKKEWAPVIQEYIDYFEKQEFPENCPFCGAGSMIVEKYKLDEDEEDEMCMSECPVGYPNRISHPKFPKIPQEYNNSCGGMKHYIIASNQPKLWNAFIEYFKLLLAEG
ncbi:hypothetical protein KKG81_10225 [bacterium]|nr:hypothetical protein [bacterium]